MSDISAEKIKELNEKIPQVYNAGVRDGKAQKENDFWDKFQDNGKRTSYYYAFYGKYWTDELFKPKYDFDLKGMHPVRMFEQTGITDLKGILEQRGIVLKNLGPNMANMFTSSAVTHLPELNVVKVNTGVNLFYNCKNLIDIEKLIMSSTSPNNAQTSWFYGCSSLEDVVFEGVFFTSISFQDSPKLNTRTIINIIECLSDEVTGQGLTFHGDAVAAMQFEDTAYNNWEELINTKSNWTISTFQEA